MKPLSGLDATFLYAETAKTPMSVISTVIVEGPIDFDSFVARVESRLPALLPFRRRLVEMPFGLDHPVWIEDPEFDVREHISRMRAPEPGDDRALETVVGRLARSRLDRTRALWEMTVVDGLSDDRTALVTRAHHAAVDGLSGAAVLLRLFDLPEEGTGSFEMPDDWNPECLPSTAQLLRHGLSRVRQRPRQLRKAVGHLAQSLVDLTRAHLGPESPTRDATLPFGAPESPFNGPLSARRVVAYARTPFESVRSIRAAFGGTVNDVVLAACSRALRAELADRGALPERPLVAAVPVSTRRFEDPADCGNRISALLAPLPVALEDPVHQLAEVARGTRQAKRLHTTMGAETLASLAELTTPALVERPLGWYSRLGLSSLHRPLVNLVISNVPGPPTALSLLGQPVQALHPHGPLLDGAGLNITVLSYAGSIDIGILACQERYPEPRRLAARVAEAIEELAKLARAEMPGDRPVVRRVA